jgi:hypothetical protein
VADHRQIIFAVPEGGDVVITFPPEPLTPDTIVMVEELCAIWFRGLHRRAIKRDRQAAAEVEYASWDSAIGGVSVPPPAVPDEPNNKGASNG